VRGSGKTPSESTTTEGGLRPLLHGERPLQLAKTDRVVGEPLFWPQIQPIGPLRPLLPAIVLPSHVKTDGAASWRLLNAPSIKRLSDGAVFTETDRRGPVLLKTRAGGFWDKRIRG
jgi:hypothetical protein